MSLPWNPSSRAPSSRVARDRRSAGPLLGAVALAGVVLVVGCGSNTERTLPDAAPPAADSLTAPQLVTEAQRALSQASSVHVGGMYRENNKPVLVDMTILTGDKATGKVVADGSTVELRRLGDQLFVRGDDKFLDALGPKAKATKGKWLVGPVAQADKGLAQLTDLQRFAATLSPGKGTLTKEAVRSLNGQKAVSVRSSTGARLWVADTGPAFPLRVERIGAATGFIDYGKYNAKVDVPAPTPTVPLASVTS
jgi:hypothetical protein